MTVAFGSPPPVNVGLRVIPSLAETPLSATSVSVTFGGKPELSVKVTPALVPMFPARSAACATSRLLPMAGSAICRLQAVPLGLVVPITVPLSNSVMTGIPVKSLLTVPLIVWLAWLVSPPVLVIATTAILLILLLPAMPAPTP